MIYTYLGLIITLSIYEIWNLKKKGLSKEIFVLIGSMAFVAVFGVLYLSDTFRPSLASYLLKLFGYRG